MQRWANEVKLIAIGGVNVFRLFQVYNAPKLMEYCQGFLLQNMVALLTYDDSVKRLLFAKKIPNHDVLSGLLATLQSRIKARRAAVGGSTSLVPPAKPSTHGSLK